MMMKRLTQFAALGSLFLIATTAYPSAPMWTFTPLTATTQTIPTSSTTTVQYTITNQSSRTHSLVMTPTPNVSQVTTTGNCPNPFILGAHQSCTLTLEITGHVSGGPVVCEHGNALQCYQPNAANSLHISASLPLMLYGVTGDGSASLPESLFTLDPATGNASFVMPLGNGDDGEVIASDGLNLYHWSGSIGFAIYERINLNNLTTTNIPLSGDALKEPTGAVYFNSIGKFLVSGLSIPDPATLYGVSLGGLASTIGEIGVNQDVRGLACYNHRIYAINPFNPFIYEINPSTGQLLSTAPVTLAGFTVTGGVGLTVHPDTGVFYALLKVTGSTPRKLVTIDVTTGVATLIGNADDGSGVAQFSTIAFHPADASC